MLIYLKDLMGTILMFHNIIMVRASGRWSDQKSKTGKESILLLENYSQGTSCSPVRTTLNLSQRRISIDRLNYIAQASSLNSITSQHITSSINL